MYITCPKCNTRYLLPDNVFDKGGRTVRCTNCGFRWFQSPANPDGDSESSAPSVDSSRAASAQPFATDKYPLPRAADTKSASRGLATFTIQSFLSASATRFPFISPAALRAFSISGHIPHNISPGMDPHIAKMLGRTIRVLRIICILLALIIVMLMPLNSRHNIVLHHPELAVVLEPLGIYDTSEIALADVNVSKTIIHGGAIRTKVECSILNESKGSRLMPDVWATLSNADGVVIATSPILTEAGKNMKSGALSPCTSYTFDANKEAEHVQIDMAAPFDHLVRR